MSESSEQGEPDGALCYWRCPNCGQMNFSEEPPDMCDFCQDFTTWQLVTEDPQTYDQPAKDGQTRKATLIPRRPKAAGDE
jgi:hypothetical protein